MTLLDEFKNTREKSVSKYADYTEKMKSKVHVYTEDELKNLAFPSVNVTVTPVTADSVSYILYESEGQGRRAVLNFADGYKPGGEVLWSEVTTQEECLCRSSNLYEALIMDTCKEKYYDYNRHTEEYRWGKSSDRIIYSSDCMFFKNAELMECAEITERNICDVITCPAPIEGTAADEEVLERMKGIIKVAADHKVEELILGAWGCGAFGNDLKTFWELWIEAITECNYVPKITFAFLHVPEFLD